MNTSALLVYLTPLWLAFGLSKFVFPRAVITWELKEQEFVEMHGTRDMRFPPRLLGLSR